MPRPRQLNFDLDARLLEQREQNLGVLVPIPLSERLERLTELLYHDGHGHVSRKELVAALLFAATEDPGELAQCLAAYRRARVRNALVGGAPTENVVSFPRRRPGPRNRSSKESRR